MFVVLLLTQEARNCMWPRKYRLARGKRPGGGIPASRWRERAGGMDADIA